MVEPAFESLFECATGHRPFLYQTRLATEPYMPWLLHVPTGCGKTAAAIMAWLYRRRWHPDKAVRRSTPRRLVYCLPMRVLVEQTYSHAREWLSRLGLLGSHSSPDSIGIHLLMGGETEDDWCLYPERDAIIIGTQDMLLSRALNRGYGMSRFRWPQAFGLINSDSLWIMDEVQLMGPGLSTSLQLDAFRKRFGTYGPCKSLWMSATADRHWFSTVDWDMPENGIFGLCGEDLSSSPSLAARLSAPKTLQQLPSSSKQASSKEIADFVISAHKDSSLSLVILNTVDRAVAVYDQLTKRLKKGRSDSPAPEVLLVHSRFRPPERVAINEKLSEKTPSTGRIIVSTQVVEAGVDISAGLLVAELAPWASMVQRFGRANRYGELPECTIHWIDVSEKEATPYCEADMAEAREQLKAMEGCPVSPSSLPNRPLRYEPSHVLRAKDLVELFDTTPDISGNYVDPSRFIRDAEDHDVLLFWRNISKLQKPRLDEPTPRRQELCAVHIGQARSFLEAPGVRAFVYDHLAESWVEAKDPTIKPGQTIMVSSDSGGYDTTRGFHPSSRDVVPTVRLPSTPVDSLSRDRDAERSWQTLKDHSNGVVEEMRRIVDALDGELSLDHPLCDTLYASARFHDRGKGHPVFIETMAKAANASPPPRLDSDLDLWAKAPRLARHSRRYFRHELASALAILNDPRQAGLEEGLWLNLAAYLVAAHHGKVRLSIRSMPDEAELSDDRRHALGLYDGDELRRVDVGGGHIVDAISLDLDLMEIGSSLDGSPSWLDRMLRLRDHFGPFKLAYLEALLRAADARASSSEPAQSRPAKEGDDE